jgi:hypothetical protein
VVAATQELIAFVVVRFETCLAQRVGHGPEDGVSHLISVLIQGFEAVYITHSDSRRCSCFIKRPSIWQSRHFRSEQFSLHFLS